jgi:hypothetical protein
MVQKAPPVKLRLWKKLVFAAILLACVLFGLELGFRLCGYEPAPGSTSETDHANEPPQPEPCSYFAICDQYLGYRNRPHGAYRWHDMGGHPLSTTDEYGFRNGFGWTAEGQSPIVLFVGDSYTFCAEVNDDQTGPSEVGKLLSKEFHIRVLNAGVRSYSTLQSKRMMIQCFRQFPSILVVVYTYCANDVAENIVPNWGFPVKRPLIVRDETTGQFREAEVTNPVVPWGTSFLQWRAPPEPPPGFLAVLAGGLDQRSAVFHSCRTGWHRIEATWLSRLELPSGSQPVPPEDFVFWQEWAVENGGREVLRRLLADMDQICLDHGATFLVTQAAYNEENVPEAPYFPQDCAAAGVRFCSLDQKFKPDARPYIARYANGQWQGHFNSRGTQAFAEILTPVLKRILRSRLPNRPPAVTPPADNGHPR